jgi:hypothetical protein
MAYWAVAQLQPQRERLALNLLARADFQVYRPRLREWRTMREGRQQQCELPLFPEYASNTPAAFLAMRSKSV